MSEEDQKFFPCNIFTFDLNGFLGEYGLGLRTYIANEPLDNLDAGFKRLARLRAAYYAVSFLHYIAKGYFIYLLLHMTGLTYFINIICDNVLTLFNI